jgi:hypothetical protein
MSDTEHTVYRIRVGRKSPDFLWLGPKSSPRAIGAYHSGSAVLALPKGLQEGDKTGVEAWVAQLPTGTDLRIYSPSTSPPGPLPYQVLARIVSRLDLGFLPASIWLEDESGNVLFSENDVLGGSRSAINFSWPILKYLVAERGWDLSKATVLAADLCSDCLSTVLSELEGESFNTPAGTRCFYCKYIRPEVYQAVIEKDPGVKEEQRQFERGERSAFKRILEDMARYHELPVKRKYQILQARLPKKRETPGAQAVRLACQQAALRDAGLRGKGGMLRGWITPEGEYYGLGTGAAYGGAHVDPFLKGKLPLPKGIPREVLGDYLEVVEEIVDRGNYIRVNQGTFQTKDLSENVLERIDEHLLQFAKNYEMKGSLNPYIVEPLNGSRSLYFTWEEFVENDFRIPRPRMGTTLPKGEVGRVADLRREAVRQEALRHFFDPNAQMAIVAPVRRANPPAINRKLVQRAVQYLQEKGLRFTSGTGIYGGYPEKSFLVWNMSEPEALDFMVSFGQDSVIVKRKGDPVPHMLNQEDHTDTPAKAIRFGTEDDVEDLTDRTQFRRDPAQRWTLDFDWGKAVPWSLPGDLVLEWEEVRSGTPAQGGA